MSRALEENPIQYMQTSNRFSKQNKKDISERIYKNCYSISSPVLLSEYCIQRRDFIIASKVYYLCTLFQISEGSLNK